MTLQVGDKVVVFNAGTDYSRAVKIEPVEVGDKVTVVTLSDGTKLPLPRIDLSTSEYVFVLPKWDLPFKIGGDISWELMTLGAAVFTITAAACHVLTDEQREWTGGELSGCQIWFLTGYLKRTYADIIANTDTEYEVKSGSKLNNIFMFGQCVDEGNYSLMDLGGVYHEIKDVGSINAIGNSLTLYISAEYALIINFSQTLNTINAYTLEIKWRAVMGRLNCLQWLICWFGGDNVFQISDGSPIWKQIPNFDGSGVHPSISTVIVNSEYPEPNVYINDGVYGVSGSMGCRFNIRKMTVTGSPLTIEIQSMKLYDVEGNPIDQCIGGIRGAQAGDKYVIYDPSYKKLKMSDSHKTILSSAYWRDVLSTGEEISVGPVEYIWDGQGKVYLSQSETTLSTIMYDDQLKVVGTSKTLDYDDHAGEPITVSSVTVQRELVNITSILRAGKNQITLVVKDTTGTKIGFPTPVYIVRSM